MNKNPNETDDREGEKSPAVEESKTSNTANTLILCIAAGKCGGKCSYFA